MIWTYVVVEQSLTGLEDTLGELNARVESIETETRDMVRSQVLMPPPLPPAHEQK